jgi:hypothetical protein
MENRECSSCRHKGEFEPTKSPGACDNRGSWWIDRRPTLLRPRWFPSTLHQLAIEECLSRFFVLDSMFSAMVPDRAPLQVCGVEHCDIPLPIVALVDIEDCPLFKLGSHTINERLAFRFGFPKELSR